MRGTKGGLSDLKQLRQQLKQSKYEAARIKHTASSVTPPASDEGAAALEKLLKMVTPLPPDSRVQHAAKPSPDAPELRRAAALGEATARADLGVSDTGEITHLLSAGGTAYVRSDTAPDTARNLRRGQWRTGAELDLHGLRVEQARHALIAFLDECREHGVRCIRVVHGKGYGSSGMEPILKDKVRTWLVQLYEVQAFSEAPEREGGAGALLVLLRQHEGSRK